MFICQSYLDPQTIDMNFYAYLPIVSIEILYQYEYVAQLERPNYGTIATCRGKDSAYRCDYIGTKTFFLNDVI